MVVSFLDNDWMPSHVTGGVFQANNNSRKRLASRIEKLLMEFNLMDKVNIPFI